ncbi:heavy metal translocating P-type ATPase, partial [Acinetobacter baumannii]
LETGSSHPLAKAILARAEAAATAVTPATDLGAIAGKGVTGTVDGVPLFLGAASAVAERTTLAPDIAARIQAFNDEG